LREQINKFINELSPVFAPAVSRVRCLLDAWKPFDLTVPEVLKITALPNTVERFMMEETGQNQSYIRKLQDKRTPRQRNGKTQSDKKEIVDKFCNFCGMHGHIITSCEFKAKLLIANDSLSKVDLKAKKELQETFKKEQQKRRERHLQKHTKIIRHLIDAGGSKDDMDAALAELQKEYHNSDTEDSESTDSSSE
jgi:hypothetical protein